jgi:hypothetical protein
MLSAAALVAGTPAAMADDGAKSKTQSFQFLSALGGTYCDGARLHVEGSFAVGEQLYSACGGSMANIPIYGAVGKSKELGKDVTWFYATQHTEMAYSVQLPLKNGGSWGLWSLAGSSFFLVNAGTIKLGYTGDRITGSKSTAAKLQEVIGNANSGGQR